jgi:hypothetical protein
LLSLGRDVLAGVVSPEEALDVQAKNSGLVDEVSSLAGESGAGVFAACAADAALNCALGYDEAVYSERGILFAGEPSLYDQAMGNEFFRIREHPAAGEHWEAHRWAAVINSYLGLSPDGGLNLDAVRMRAFWLYWLREEVPLVLGSLNQVRSLLHSGGEQSSGELA